MRKIKFLNILLLFFIIFSLTGCSEPNENAEINKKGLELAKEYYKEKYKEDLDIENYEVSVVYFVSDLVPFYRDYINTVKLYNEKENTYIYVDLDKNVVYDNIQSKEILSDMKKYIQKVYFEGNSMNLDNTLDLGDYISTLEVYETYPQIKMNNDKVKPNFFGAKAYYDGNIEEFIKNTELSINLSVTFIGDIEVSKDNYIDEMKRYKDRFEIVLESIQKDFTNPKFNSEIDFTLYIPFDSNNIPEEVKVIIYNGISCAKMTINSMKYKDETKWITVILYDKDDE